MEVKFWLPSNTLTKGPLTLDSLQRNGRGDSCAISHWLREPLAPQPSSPPSLPLGKTLPSFLVPATAPAVPSSAQHRRAALGSLWSAINTRKVNMTAWCQAHFSSAFMSSTPSPRSFQSGNYKTTARNPSRADWEGASQGPEANSSTSRIHRLAVERRRTVDPMLWLWLCWKARKECLPGRMWTRPCVLRSTCVGRCAKVSHRLLNMSPSLGASAVSNYRFPSTEQLQNMSEDSSLLFFFKSGFQSWVMFAQKYVIADFLLPGPSSGRRPGSQTVITSSPGEHGCAFPATGQVRALGQQAWMGSSCSWEKAQPACSQ